MIFIADTPELTVDLGPQIPLFPMDPMLALRSCWYSPYKMLISWKNGFWPVHVTASRLFHREYEGKALRENMGVPYQYGRLKDNNS
ncbi:hypothetical protein PQS30_02050 [Bacillus licheniformis]|uniref:hypothetical protein n=1 Tax=Bacillus licheniformis TaxID=1402 RepID=UPI003979E2F5